MSNFKEKFNKKNKRTRYFHHNLIEFEELEVLSTEEGRKYVTPTGEAYFSVTTVLSQLDDGKGLDEWRARVGEEEANRVSNRASSRGTTLHSIAEEYVMNKDEYLEGKDIFSISMFNSFKHFFENINIVHGSEICLYSHLLQTAGRCDLFATYNGVLSIVDFKTSIRQKVKEWIEGYFIQTACYAIMVEELTGLKIPQLVILMAVENGESLEFIVNTDDYREKTIKLFTERTVS